MCGIAVLISLNNLSPPLLQIQKMTDLIRHRGPDDEGYVFFGNRSDCQPQCFGGMDTPDNVYQSEIPYTPSDRLNDPEINDKVIAFGHRRLSIIDLTPAGHQPMSYAEGRFWITYNGEIYNYRELRTELESKGHSFFSNSDTEVILAAYMQWGKDCLHRFNGMWAFVIFDAETGQIFASRDRFGIKPLYYWYREGELLAFGSEIKQFTGLDGWKARMNGQRVFDFIHYALMDHTSETMFKNVYQMPGGTAVECGIPELDRNLPVYRWYTPAPQPFKGDFDAAVMDFSAVMSDAVQLRLRADVPVGSCLSGGLDSSTIVCLIHSFLKDNHSEDLQNTFSACSDIAQYDERFYIDEVVREKRINAYYVYPQVDHLFSNLDAITWYQDEPNAGSNILFQWDVFKIAKEKGVRVMLDGQGADETLAGYHHFFIPFFVDLIRQFKWVLFKEELLSIQRLHGYSPFQSITSVSSSFLLDLIKRSSAKNLWNRRKRPQYIDLEQLQALPDYPDLEYRNLSTSLLNHSLSQLVEVNLPMLLHYEDRNSMAHSIESRVPFLDFRLVEFVLGLPDTYKISEGVTKRILRESMKDILPKRIYERMDKMGFVSPEEIWVRYEAPDRFRQLLEDAIRYSNGILDSTTIEMLNEMIQGKRPYDSLVWRLISFGSWIKTFDIET